MSRTNVRNFVRSLPQEMRLEVENELATVESVFDLGYFQLDDGKDCVGS
jgi:hypothetical protein